MSEKNDLAPGIITEVAVQTYVAPGGRAGARLLMRTRYGSTVAYEWTGRSVMLEPAQLEDIMTAVSQALCQNLPTQLTLEDAMPKWASDRWPSATSVD